VWVNGEMSCAQVGSWRVELKPFQQVGAPNRIEAAAQPSEQIDYLTAGEVGPQIHLARHVGEATVQRGHIPPRVLTQHGDVPLTLPRAMNNPSHGASMTVPAAR